MKVAVIGGGAAGLFTAWLLDNCHDVVLFEKESTLGGHAQTIHVPVNNTMIPVDLGFEFFTPQLFPHFFKLLDHLAVPINAFSLTSTLYTSDKKTKLVFPHIGNIRSLISLLLPKQFMTLFRFLYFIKQGDWIVIQKKQQITIQDFIDSLGFPESFKDTMLYPMLSAGWGTTIENFKLFSAYNILKWIQKEMGTLWPSTWFEITDGSSSYIDTLTKQFTRTKIKTSCTIQHIIYENSSYKIIEADGSTTNFEHLIFATSPQDASKLLSEIAHAASRKTVLDQIEYFPSVVVIHGDSSVMPNDTSSWSVANICYDNKNSALTIYKRWQATTIFKTWMIQDPSTQNVLPNTIYALKYFQHQATTPLYFTAQEQLRQLQGVNNIWVVGTYTYDIDSHESALISALLAAKKLAPHSQRLSLFNH